MNVFLVRPELSLEGHAAYPVRLIPPMELFALESLINPNINKEIDTKIIDLALDVGGLKRYQSESPKVIIISAKGHRHEKIEKAFKESREIYPQALIAKLGGEVEKDLYDIDIKVFNYLAINELLLGVLTNRTIEEINSNLSSYVEEELKPINIFNKKYSNGYYFLNYENVADIFTSSLVKPIEGFKSSSSGELSSLEALVENIEKAKLEAVYFKDEKLTNNTEILKDLIDIIETKEVSFKSILIGNTDFVLNNEKLLEHYSKLGLEAMIITLNFPTNEETWINNQEAFRLLKKHQITPVVEIEELPNKEDKEAMLYWLKENKIENIVLNKSIIKENIDVYEDFANSFGGLVRDIGNHGFGEAFKRRGMYSKAVDSIKLTHL